MTAPSGFELPEPIATLDLVMEDGAPIRVVRHGNPFGPRVVLSHGNGFASDSYFPFWRHMLERFDLALFDFRNCGRNPFHAAEPHNYPRFARDNVTVHHAIAEAWGGKTTVGVFHSMSAIAALLLLASVIFVTYNTDWTAIDDITDPDAVAGLAGQYEVMSSDSDDGVIRAVDAGAEEARGGALVDGSSHIGPFLIRELILPFETLGLLLIAALIGALIVIRGRREDDAA